MTTPDTCTTCATCGLPLRAEHYGIVRHHNETERHIFQFTEAPAPAAPSDPGEAAWATFERAHEMTATELEVAHEAFDAGAAARAPGGAAGEALEAALREIVRHVYEEPMSEEHIVTTAQAALAAARAPGPVGGLSAEVRAEVIAALREVRRHVYEEPISEEYLMEVTGPALQHALGILDGVINEAAPSPEPSA